MSLTNSLGMEDFNTNVLTSPQQDIHYHPKMFNIGSPIADKLNKFYQSKNNQHVFAQNNLQKGSLDNIHSGAYDSRNYGANIVADL